MRSRIQAVVACVAAIPLLSGCSAFRASIREKSPDSPPLTARYDQSDLRGWAQEVADAILSHPFPADDSRPIVAELGIVNRTATHVDTMALANTIVTKLLDSGKMQFVNTERRDALMREQGFQVQNATEETRSKMGRQLGARYMLTGSITEITSKSEKQVRLSKKEDVYYQITVEVTDLETGLFVLRKQRERMREARKPLIGW